MTAHGALSASLLLVLGSVLGGCGLLPGVGNETLHVLNNTTIAVTLVVNGRQIAVVQPSTSADVGPTDLGDMPWHAQALTSGGRELVALDVEPGSVHEEVHLDGTGSYSAPAARIDLSCGQIRLWAGRIMPGGPVPGSGMPGDCAP